MPPPETKPKRKRVLEPNERIAEILFGLIMVLGFTGSLSAAQAGRAEVRTMLFGAIGCNLAWGLIDGIMYLMACLSARGADLKTFRALQDAADPRVAARILAEALPSVVARVMRPEELESLRARLLQLPGTPDRPRLHRDDWLGAGGVFLLVFLSTFPVVVPFIFIQHPQTALRVSNVVAIVLLFFTGSAFGRYAGLRPVPTGAAMVVLGVAMVGLTIALGG